MADEIEKLQMEGQKADRCQYRIGLAIRFQSSGLTGTRRNAFLGQIQLRIHHQLSSKKVYSRLIESLMLDP